MAAYRERRGIGIGIRGTIFAPPPIGPGTRTNARRHAQLFVLGLVFTSLIGTVLLALPWMTRSGQGTPMVDAFFTSVSAASVTGLSVVDTLEHWNCGGRSSCWR